MKEPRFNSTQMCRICGYQPDGKLTDQPTSAVTRWWDPNDGFVIGHLCCGCWDDYGSVEPSSDDFAFSRTNEICDREDTDEDIQEVLGEA